METYDFCGYATRNDLQCADGRVIRRNAFKGCDGKTVPLMWSHQHSNVGNVLGHALLENREDGVYCYGKFNNSDAGVQAKAAVDNGDITAMSIYANHLTQDGPNVMHGIIREVSLVMAGANPGASIDTVIRHGETYEDEAVIFTGENFSLSHAEPEAKKDDEEGKKEENMEDTKKKAEGENDEETVKDVFDTLTEKQKTVVYAMVGAALQHDDSDDNEEENEMKHNVFDADRQEDQVFLSHADQESIINRAKSSACGTLQAAIESYAMENDELAHGFESIETLFPDAQFLHPGAPEQIPEDTAWVSTVMKKVHKSPFARVRTRQADVSAIRASGYKTKGHKKSDIGNITLVGRTTDPQTVYIKDKLNRDDIIDITDFDVVQYEYGVMRNALNEELAQAFLIGDGREPGDEQKIEDVHIRPVWTDDELYTIHVDVDVAKAKAELQGTNTGANFGDNYVYAEAVITAALYAREKYKGSGALDFYCDPHLLNVMLLARDMNGRRIYNSKADLVSALNVKDIYTVETFSGKTRKTDDEESKTKKLLGLFVNMDDYNVGSVRKGEIAQFNDFDIDFNQEKFMIETRLSGALTRVKSAIALEEDVTV